MKIWVLIENTAKDDHLICEHGLSFYITYEGKHILLDAGSTDAFWYNAKKMGISLEQVDFAVLSHGHYDHSGGFEIFFKQNPDTKVYARQGADKSYLSGNGGLHEIGIPENVRKYEDRFVFVEGLGEICPNVYLVPHHSAELERIGARAKLYRKMDGALLPDDFAHEQSLVFDTPEGLIIFNSCSHGGVRNIIREAKEACGGKHVYAYVGGLHMKGRENGEEICTFSDAEVDSLCKAVEDENIAYVYTGHCTGQPGLRKLQEKMGDRVRALTTGMQIEL